jgi:predicted nucleotidyltransferase
MALPNFDSNGELPAGVHQATIDEVFARFGGGSLQRQAVTENLRKIFEAAVATGKLERLIIFGSYATNKPNPNDVDVVLIFRDDFDVTTCDDETRKLLDHKRATQEFGASIFWIRPSLLLLDTLDEFIKHWQIKRDRTRRGIVEVRS